MARSPVLSVPLLAEVERRRAAGETWRAIGADLSARLGVGVTTPQLLHYRDAHREDIAAYLAAEQARAATATPDGPTIGEEDAYFRAVEANYLERDRLWPKPPQRVTIPLPDRRPVLIAMTGDWHVGHPHVAYDRLRRDLELLRDTPGAYVFGMGDYKDNRKVGKRSAAGLYDGGEAGGKAQDRWLLTLWRLVVTRLLACVWGNHDAWDASEGGVDAFAELCQKVGAHNLGHGAVVELALGSERYVFGLRHNYPGKSAINSLNNQRRYLESIAAEQPDVVCLAHFHFNDMGEVQKYGIKHPTVMFRSGTYITRDDYAEQVAGASGQIGTPSVLLYPDRHCVLPFYGDRLAEAVDYLRRLRADAA